VVGAEVFLWWDLAVVGAHDEPDLWLGGKLPKIVVLMVRAVGGQLHGHQTHLVC
jgi:hypothetical protein